MKKILIMADYYYPRALANGVCVHQVALELKKRGYAVHVVCFNNFNEAKNDIYDGINVHRLKTRPYVNNSDISLNSEATLNGKFGNKINYFMTRLNILMFMPVYPIASFLSLMQYYKLVKSLHEKYYFNLVISVYNPIESIISGMLLKKKYKNIKFVMYTLDTLTNNTGVRFFSKKKIEDKGWKWEQKVYKYADKIFNMKCHESHYSQDRYEPYKEKMDILDIPLINKQVYTLIPFKNRRVNLVYTGGLNSRTRNPSYVCELFLLLNNNQNNRLHFYSRGDCETILQEYQMNSDSLIKRHGYLKHKESINIINNAQVLISIGNELSDMIPSKVFEYMSTGKPIIHFYKNINDPCLQYFRKYPLALTIYEVDEIQENAELIKKFIEKTKNKEVLFESVEKLFYLNTPKFTADELEKVLKDY